MKILYIVPLAYYSGHPPWAARYEPKALQDVGNQVTLLTFCGLMRGMYPQVRNIQYTKDRAIFRAFRKYTAIRLLFMTYEIVVTVRKALKMRNDYDVLYLRDGEPGIFLVHLLTLPYKNVKWAVSMMGSVVCAPREKRDSINRWHLDWYTKGIEFFNGTLWRGLYRKSLKRNAYVLITQNHLITEAYTEWQTNIFKGKVFTVPMGTLPAQTSIARHLAREQLGLPHNQFILLCFGAPHPGKDIEVVYKAASMLPNTFVLYAGIAKFSIGDEPKKLVSKYGLENRSKILDYYIPEEEKTALFSAANVCMLSYTSEFKCTPSVLWDACKYGIPVVASEANTLGELVKEYQLGLTFRNSDHISLADALSSANTLNEKTIEQNCKKFTDEYSLNNWAKRITQVVQEHLLG